MSQIRARSTALFEAREKPFAYLEIDKETDDYPCAQRPDEFVLSQQGSRWRLAIPGRGRHWHHYRQEVIDKAKSLKITLKGNGNNKTLFVDHGDPQELHNFGIAVLYFMTVDIIAETLATEQDPDRRRQLALDAAVMGLELSERLAKLGVTSSDLSSAWATENRISKEQKKAGEAGAKTAKKRFPNSHEAANRCEAAYKLCIKKGGTEKAARKEAKNEAPNGYAALKKRLLRKSKKNL